MQYPGAVLPISTPREKASREELRSYFQWFVSNIPARVAVLESAVRSTPEFEAWNADDERESFELLGIWFASRIEVRPKSPEELEAEKRRLGKFWHPDQPVIHFVITDQVKSSAYDLGVYFGRALAKQSGVAWTQDWARTSVHYGDPILKSPRSRMTLSPTQIMAIHAQKLAKRSGIDGVMLTPVFDLCLSHLV